MSIWPLVIALVILAVATVLFFMLPSIIDFHISFLWVAGIFIIIYIGAAIYLAQYFSHFVSKPTTAEPTNITDPVVSTE